MSTDGRRAESAYFATRTTLSLRTYLTMVPVALLAAATAVPGASGAVMLQWLGAGVVAEVAVGLVLLLGFLAGKRMRFSRTLVVSSVALAYAARGFVLVVVTGALDVPDSTSPVLRVVASMMNMTMWTLLIGAAWQARADYVSSLRQVAVRMEAMRRRVAEPSDADISPEASAVRAEIAAILDRYDPRDARAWAQELQHAVDEELRPLSHRVAAAGRQGPTRILRLRQLLWRAARQPVPAIVTAIVLVAFVTSNSLLRFPLVEALASSVVLAALALVALAITEWLRARGVRTELANTAFLLLFVVVVPLLLNPLISLVLPKEPEFASTLGVALVSLTVVLAAAVVRAAASLAADVVREVSEDVDALDLVLEQGWLDRSLAHEHLASFLHDTLQSRLTALHLEAAAHSGEVDSETLSSIRTLVNRPLTSGIAPRDAMADLHQAVHSWSGLVRVQMAIDPAVAEDPRLGRVASFAQEALTNAARHGGARVVSIGIHVVGDGLVCVVSDDGTWAEGSPALGLSAARGLDVTVAHRESGTVVRAVTQT